MSCIEPGTVGILPVGALGAAFYFHLTRELADVSGKVVFLPRRGSTNRTQMRTGAVLRIAAATGLREFPIEQICRPGLIECARSGRLPELLLVCTQPDQLLAVISEYVELIEYLTVVMGLDAALRDLPLLILSSNGIYHQRVRRFLVEALEESMLYGRLPDLWSGAMGRIVGKLLRGVTIQTGQREGQGQMAIYRPGPSGVTRLGGGDPANRRRCGEVLQSLGGRFEVSEDETPTRIEFDKGLVNLCGNLLGQLKAIDEMGKVRLLTVGEIFPGPESPETRELATHVIAVGRAVQAYRAEEDFETLYRSMMVVARGPMRHVPSSIQWIVLQLRAGTLEARLSPTETWLLDPLIRYARTAGLNEAASYFAELIRHVTERLQLAISANAAHGIESIAPGDRIST